MKNSKVSAHDPRIAIKKKQYHPYTEYSLMLKREINRVGKNQAGKFHKLAAKVERSLPRGLRDSGDMYFSTTCMIIEVDLEVA